MKNKIINSKRLLCFLLLVITLLCTPSTLTSAKVSKITDSSLQKMIDGIITARQKQEKAASIQDLIDTKLVNSAGANYSDWFVIGLSRYKSEYDFQNYKKALEAYAANLKHAKATDYQRIALVYSSIDQNADAVLSTLKETTGQLGIMSYIYGLILLDSGSYTYQDLSRDAIIDKILELKLADGGWALSGKVSDIDITAMALQALAPYDEKSKVKKEVNKAITLLSKRQQDTGDYQSWGTRCCESTAQVIMTLAALDINIETDKRFIKNSNTLLDGLLLYRLKDGSFSHTIAGKSDKTASVQAMNALIALLRQRQELSAFYDFGSASSSVSITPPLSGTINSSKTGVVTDRAEMVTDQTATVPDQTITVADQETVVTKTPTGSVTSDQGFHFDYKIIVTMITVLAVCLILGFLYILKRRGRRNYIIVLSIAGILLAAVWGLKFQSVEDYYQMKGSAQAGSGMVILSIRCDTIVGKSDHIPADGIILDKKEIPLKTGDSVLDILILAAKQYQLVLDYEGGADTSISSAYIKGINNIYESDYGDQSGWLYRVNGKFPGTTCADYKVKENDRIEWVYTTDLGKDVGKK